MSGRRAFVVVLDACGVGALPDAADYGDAGTNTLSHLARALGGLSLPTLGVDAPVQPVDVRSDGQLAVPDDARVVGWWAQGARPGSPRGSVVIDGHVDTSRDGPGALFHLARLEPGATIMISGPGGSLTYRVAAIRRYPKTALPAEQEATLEGLRSAHGYLQRRVASELHLKNTPELRFILDDTAEKAFRVEELLEEGETAS